MSVFRIFTRKPANSVDLVGVLGIKPEAAEDIRKSASLLATTDGDQDALLAGLTEAIARADAETRPARLAELAAALVMNAKNDAAKAAKHIQALKVESAKTAARAAKAEAKVAKAATIEAAKVEARTTRANTKAAKAEAKVAEAVKLETDRVQAKAAKAEAKMAKAVKDEATKLATGRNFGHKVRDGVGSVFHVVAVGVRMVVTAVITIGVSLAAMIGIILVTLRILPSAKVTAPATA